MIRFDNLRINFDNLLEKRGKKLRLKKEKSKQFADGVINDLRKNRNWSWYKELRYRNENNLDSIALFYRGNEITYREMFSKMEEYAKSLKTLGVTREDEIPICMSNTPEFVYTLGAISMIGAKANVFSSDYDKDYLTEILKECSSKVVFIEDNKYLEISDIIKNSNYDNVVLSSLKDSLPNGKNPYEDLDKPHEELFKSKVSTIKKSLDNGLSVSDFCMLGRNYSGKVCDDSVTLDDIFTITYSSGTTSNRPKGIMHAVKSYNGVTRFHDPEINHTPSFKMFSMQATIPTFSSTDLMSGISDALTQGCRLSLEPIYDENFVVESLLINKPSYLDFTKSFWLKFAKDILYNPKYKNVEIPSLAICFSVGEPTSLSEEKLINKAFKKVKAGKELFHAPITKLSVAGGDCEHGGIFYKLFRAYSNLNPIHKIRKEDSGLGTFDAVDVAILDENGNHCAPYTIGNLVATSEFDMLGYKNNEEATDKFFVYDSDGKKYGDCTADAYLDYFGNVHFMNRKEKDKVSTSQISDSILKNLSDVLSCEVVNVDDYFVAHVELLPNIKNKNLSLCKINEKCVNDLGEDISSKILFRLHSTDESFKLTHSGKRDKLSLISEGISEKCVKPIYIQGKFKIMNGKKYTHIRNNEKVKKLEK